LEGDTLGLVDGEVEGLFVGSGVPPGDFVGLLEGDTDGDELGLTVGNGDFFACRF
jgi:hypothetical protein